jgi:acyl carrier protein
MTDNRVLAIIAEEAGVPPGEVRGGQAFGADLGLDSLDFVRLIMAVEQALGIKIDDKAAAQVRVVDDLLTLARAAPADPDGAAA